MDRWRNLLGDLSEELEEQFGQLQALRTENRRLREQMTAGGGSNSLSVFSQSLQRTLPGQWPAAQAQAQAATAKSKSQVWSADRELGLGSRPNNRSSWTRLRREETAQDALVELQAQLAAPKQPWNHEATHQSRVSRIIDEGRIQFTVMRANREDNHSQVRKPWFVINPDRSRAASIWQLVVGVALFFVALVTPVQVALLEPEFNWLFVVGACIDVLFVVDLVIQFFTAYPRGSGSNRVWEVRPAKICSHYLRTWFLIDFITVIPFDTLTLTSNVEELKDFVGLKILRSLRLIKLLRLMKTSKVLQDFEAPVSIPYQNLALCKFLVILAFICHWLACCWALTLRVVDKSFPRWIDGVQEIDANFGIDTISSPWRVYVVAFYFCSYTITSVGYGDVGPQNILERMVCAGMVLVAGLAWAYIIGEVGTIVADMTSEGQEFRRTMHHLNMMMRDQRLPFDLQCRVRRFFLHNRTQSLFMARQTLLTRMSPQLQAEVCVMTNLHWLQKVSFLRQFMTFIRDQSKLGNYTGPFEACVADIARSLKLTAFAQSETFDNLQVLYILSRGLVALNSRVGSLGEVWGEDFVLSDTSLVRPVSGYALTYLETMSLTRDHFMQVIQRQRMNCPELFRVVRRYCVRLAVYRGILAEAKRRLKQPVPPPTPSPPLVSAPPPPPVTVHTPPPSPPLNSNTARGGRSVKFRPSADSVNLPGGVNSESIVKSDTISSLPGGVDSETIVKNDVVS